MATWVAKFTKLDKKNRHTQRKYVTVHCNPVQGSTGVYREIPVMKTGSLQWEQGSL